MLVKSVISLTPETQERTSPTFRKSPKNISKFAGSSPDSITETPQLAVKITGSSPKSIKIESPKSFLKFNGFFKKPKAPVSSSSSPKATRSPTHDKVITLGNSFFSRINKNGLRSAGLPFSKKAALDKHRRSSEILAFSRKKSAEHKETRKRGKKDLSKYKELIDVTNVFERSERFYAECKKIFKNVRFLWMKKY